MRQLPLFVFYFLFTCVAVGMPLSAQAGGEKLPADDFYKQGKFEEALAVWYGMASAGQCNAGLYYNIGLAESQLNHTPEAIFAFEQAHRLAPGEEAIISSIVDARKKIENATIPVDVFFLSAWYKALVTFFRPGVWALLGLVLCAGGVLLIFRMTNRLPVKFQSNNRMGVYVAILGLLFAMLGFLSYRELYRDNEAIVFVLSEMHQAPAADSPQVRTLSPGEKILITDVIGEWYHVQLLNLDQGWVKENSIKPLSIGTR